jgi:subtilisin family serine protease
MRLPFIAERRRPRASGGRRRLAVLGVGTAAVLIAAAVAAHSASATVQEGPIRDAGTDGVVPNSFVVALRDSATLSTSGVNSSAHALAGRYGGRVGRVYQHALHGFEVSLSEAKARQLAADPVVAYVQRNGIYRIAGTQTNPPSWGLDRIDQRNLPLDQSYTFPTTASNVHAYIIDTGIRFTHTTFGGRAISGRDTVDNDNDATDCHGHGTHVAGTVGGSQYGVAKGVTLVGVRVLDCNGSGTTAGVVAGVDWVTANSIKPAVANMSLGGGIDTTLDNAVAGSINSGVTYAIAAGNSNANACNFSPARVPAAITVGATDINDNRASFSNFGTCVDIFAPGVNITSSWLTSDTATNTISGTSMATPHVTGGAALIASANPGFTPQQVRDAMVNNATNGVVANPGTGSPNKLLFVGGGSQPPPPPPPGCTGTNDTNVSIPDAGAAVTSPITISGCNRNASATSKIEVHIKHTYRGDLVIDLVAPDGTAVRLKNSNGSDSADNVDQTFTRDLSAKAANGTWRLRVRDVFAVDTGFIDSWTLTL